MGLDDHTFISDRYTTVLYSAPLWPICSFNLNLCCKRSFTPIKKYGIQYICSITPAQLLRMLYLVPSSVVLDKLVCMHYLLDSL